MQINSSGYAIVHQLADTARVTLRAARRAATAEEARTALGPSAASLQLAATIIDELVVDRSMSVREDSRRPQNGPIEESFVAQASITIEMPADRIGVAVSIADAHEVTVDRISWSISTTHPARTDAYRKAVAALVAKAKLTASCFDLSDVAPVMISDRPIDSTVSAPTEAAAMLGRAAGAAPSTDIDLDPPVLSISTSVYGLFSAS